MFDVAEMERKLVALKVDPRMPMWIVVSRREFTHWRSAKADSEQSLKARKEYLSVQAHVRIARANYADEELQYVAHRSLTLPASEIPECEDTTLLREFLSSLEREGDSEDIDVQGSFEELTGFLDWLVQEKDLELHQSA